MNEALRVPRPGARFCIMLCARRSWVSLGFWLRYGLAVGRPWRSLGEVRRGEARMMYRDVGALRIDELVTPYDRRYVRRLADRGPALWRFFVARAQTWER